MDIEELREKALKHITSCIDPEWHSEGYPVMSEIIWEGFLSLPYIEEKECPECHGEGCFKSKRLKFAEVPKGWQTLDCSICHGFGTLPPVTVGEWLALASPEALDIIKKG